MLRTQLPRHAFFDGRRSALILRNSNLFSYGKEDGDSTRENTALPIVSFPSTGGMAVSRHTLGSAKILRNTAAAALGIPVGRGGRKQ